MATSVTAAEGAIDPTLAAYYAGQRRNVADTYQIGLAQNTEQKQLTDLNYQQKLQALQNTLGQQQSQLPDPYAAKGILNSGIYNYAGTVPGQMGAKQQFAYNSALSLGNLRSQQNLLDQQSGQKGQQLGIQYQDSMNGIAQQSAVDQARQAVNDALTGA